MHILVSAYYSLGAFGIDQHLNWSYIFNKQELFPEAAFLIRKSMADCISLFIIQGQDNNILLF